MEGGADGEDSGIRMDGSFLFNISRLVYLSLKHKFTENRSSGGVKRSERLLQQDLIKDSRIVTYPIMAED